MKKLFTFIVLTFGLMLTPAFADMVTVKYVGSQGVVYNSYWTGPSSLLVDNDPVTGLCFDFEHGIRLNDIWTANVVSMHDLATYTPAYHYGEVNWLDKYEKIAWLGNQMSLNPSSQYGPIQWAIWSQLTPITPNVATQSWITAANVAHTNGIPTYNVDFLFPVTECKGQAFMIPSTVPEPNSIVLLSAGLVLIAIGSIRRKLTS